MEIKVRADMDPRYTWDLTPVFENDEAWEAALKDASETVATLGSIPGTLGNSVESFKAGGQQCVSERFQRLLFVQFFGAGKQIDALIFAFFNRLIKVIPLHLQPPDLYSSERICCRHFLFHI